MMESHTRGPQILSPRRAASEGTPQVPSQHAWDLPRAGHPASEYRLGNRDRDLRPGGKEALGTLQTSQYRAKL